MRKPATPTETTSPPATPPPAQKPPTARKTPPPHTPPPSSTPPNPRAAATARRIHRPQLPGRPRRKERYAALTARLQYNREAGILIERAAVEAAVEDIVIALRHALEQHPHRLAPELVGQDLDTIRATLKRETTAALAALAAGFQTRLQEIAGQPNQPPPTAT